MLVMRDIVCVEYDQVINPSRTNVLTIESLNPDVVTK